MSAPASHPSALEAQLRALLPPLESVPHVPVLDLVRASRSNLTRLTLPPDGDR